MKKFKKANQLFMNGKYSDALSLYRELISQNQYWASIVSYNIKKCESYLNQVKEKEIGNKDIILLFSERFLPRFGVDRVMLSLAGEFSRHGYNVVLIGQKIDKEIKLGENVSYVSIPEFSGADHKFSDLLVARFIRDNLSNIVNFKRIKFAISSGWPFFQTIRELNSKGISVWFGDHGINPSDGLSLGQKKTLKILRNAKYSNLYFSSGVIPVSRFIADSQTNFINVDRLRIQPILNGVDHISNPSGMKSKAIKSDCKNIFLVGRFESGNYKQSDQVWDFLGGILKYTKKVNVVILCSDAEVPIEFKEYISPVGFVSDEEMISLMVYSDHSICFSSWEGFNLPLAECQALRRICLAYSIGAHPEVAIDPWVLCNDIDEMITKSIAIISNQVPTRFKKDEMWQDWLSRFTWEVVGKNYLNYITSPLYRSPTMLNEYLSKVRVDSKFQKRRIFLPVTNSCCDLGNSGVVRVTRGIASALSNESNCEVYFIVFDQAIGVYRLPSENEFAILSAFGRGVIYHKNNVSFDPKKPILFVDYYKNLPANDVFDDWMFMIEIVNITELAKLKAMSATLNIKTAALFHDAIAVTNPELITDIRYRDSHLEYMKWLSLFDCVVPNSHHSMISFQQVLVNEGVKLPPLYVNHLGCDFESTLVQKNSGKYILMVSTLEPRKNHLKIIEAFNIAQNNVESELQEWELIFVGNLYAGDSFIYSKLKEYINNNSSIKYMGVVSDEELSNLYRNCGFVAYPSLMEGFGLPIIESAYYGKACICHDDGVMKEISELTRNTLKVDCRSISDLSRGLTSLMRNQDDLRINLESQAERYKIKSWADYCSDLVGILNVYEGNEGFN